MEGTATDSGVAKGLRGRGGGAEKELLGAWERTKTPGELWVLSPSHFRSITHLAPILDRSEGWKALVHKLGPLTTPVQWLVCLGCLFVAGVRDFTCVL